jgi:hypothetical protein
MEGLDSGGQGPTSGCCAIEEEEEVEAQLSLQADYLWP